MILYRKWIQVIIFILGGLFCGLNLLYSQEAKQIEILNADYLILDTRDEGGLRKLNGNVQLKHDSTILYCDSANLYTSRNYVEAMSNVKVYYSNSVSLFADRLTYEGTTRVAECYDHIRLQHKQRTLTTNRLTYYRIQNYGQYFNGGTLQDTANTLTSERGYYYNDSEYAYFKKNVVLVNKNYTLTTDTLAYDTRQEVAHLQAPTFVVTKDKENLYAAGGYLKTQEKEMFVYGSPCFKDSTYYLAGDTIYYNDSLDVGWARCNVRSQNKDSTLFIYGDYGTFKRKSKATMMTGDPYLIHYLNQKKDTLILFADTLYSFDDSLNRNRKLKAYPNVSITYSKSMKAIADSAVYDRVDSLFLFTKDPVMWSDSSQLTGDTIRLFMKNEAADSLAVLGNAFAISQVDTSFFDQTKGRNLYGRFNNSNLVWLFVQDNAQSYYYVKDGKKYIGLNQSFSKAIEVFLRENRPRRIRFIQQADATLYPIHEVWYEKRVLEGFKWRIQEKPPLYYGAQIQW